MSALGVPAVASVSASALDFLLLEATREYLDKGEAGHRALDRIGYTVGSQLAERYTKDRPRFGDATEVILCVCKEFWPAVFGKRIDSLKTNNKGVFVLTDVQLKWIGNVRAVGHSNADGENKKKTSFGRRRADTERDVEWFSKHLWVRCGSHRGHE